MRFLLHLLHCASIVSAVTAACSVLGCQAGHPPVTSTDSGRAATTEPAKDPSETYAVQWTPAGDWSDNDGRRPTTAGTLVPIKATDIRHDVGIGDMGSLLGWRHVYLGVARGQQIPQHPCAKTIDLMVGDPGVVSGDFSTGQDYIILFTADGKVFDIKDSYGEWIYNDIGPAYHKAGPK